MFEMCVNSRDFYESIWPYESRCEMDPRTAYATHPFFSTMAQPFVYCTKTRQCDAPTLPRNVEKNRGRNRHRGANCFMKAFKWYTQERVSNKSAKHDMSDFATWLDVKYDQFLEESHRGSRIYRQKGKQSSEAGHAPLKNKHRSKSSEGISRSARSRTNHSCRYIMEPRGNMSRQNSICCPPSCTTTTGSTCGNKSMCKSHSFSNVIGMINRDLDDVIPAQGDVADRSKSNVQYRKVDKLTTSKTSTKSNIAKKVTAETKPSNIISSKDVCCQCNEKVIKKNVPTQYDVKIDELRSPSHKSKLIHCMCQSQENANNKEELIHSPCPDAGTPCVHGITSCECTPIIKEVQQPFSKQVKCQCSKEKLITKEERCIECKCPKPNEKDINKVTRRSFINIECQCPEEKVVTVNAQTQCWSCPTANNNLGERNFEGFARSDASVMGATPGLGHPAREKVEKEWSDKRDVTFGQTMTQTSSLSICIEQTFIEYPLFLKIVRADKPCKDNVK